MKSFNDAITAHARALWLEGQRDEIERAIDNVKRSASDKWFGREWHRATSHIARRQRRGAGGRRPFRGGGKRMKGEEIARWQEERSLDVWLESFEEWATDEEVVGYRRHG
jgi:hypothetical protein